MGGGTTVSAPQPSQEELALMKTQNQLLTQQLNEQSALSSLAYQSAGYKYSEDAQGNISIVPMSEEERLANMSTLEQQQYQVAKAQAQRQLDAYAGNLPVDPVLEKNLADQKAQTESYLSQRLGPNWQETTPGIQTMSNLQQAQEGLRYQARTGEMTTGESLLLNNLQSMQAQQAQQAQLATGLPTRWSGLTQQYGQAQQPYQYYSGLGLQAQLANSQQTNPIYGMLGSAMGIAGGIAMKTAGI